MNKADLKAIVYLDAADAIRREAAVMTTGKISPKAFQHDVVKVRQIMHDLADMLESKTEKRRRKVA